MTLPDLLSRVEAATGPDRELDRCIWEAVTNECTHREKQFVYLKNNKQELECVNCGADTYGADKWSGLTASLDAALALMERVLPGWRMGLRDDIGVATAWLYSPDFKATTVRVVQGYMVEGQRGSTRSLALLAAMLKARSRARRNRNEWAAR